MDQQEAKESHEDRPPVFKTWNQLYVFVLVLHAIIITLFYLFTLAYS
jgi:hypothetical protein